MGGGWVRGGVRTRRMARGDGDGGARSSPAVAQIRIE
jgi:hypothetical protein